MNQYSLISTHLYFYINIWERSQINFDFSIESRSIKAFIHKFQDLISFPSLFVVHLIGDCLHRKNVSSNEQLPRKKFLRR